MKAFCLEEICNFKKQCGVSCAFLFFFNTVFIDLETLTCSMKNN